MNNYFIEYNGDSMKMVYKLIRNMCLGIVFMYFLNIIFKSFNLNIPINLFTISMSTLFGVFGIIAVVILKIVI